MNNMLNPIWLKTFKTLVELNHFTRTAEALFMTQPGVSQHIKKLEQACQTQLLHKKGKGFELTEQGYLVYRYACELIERQSQLLSEITTDSPTKGAIKIACSGALTQWLFPKFIEVQQKHSGLQISFESAPNARVCEHVQKGHATIGLVTHIPNPTEFNIKTIGFEPLCLVLPNGYEDRVIDRITLNELGLVDHPDAQQYLIKYLEECQNPELQEFPISDLQRVTSVNQLGQILVPIFKGIGFTVLPQSAVVSSPFTDQLTIHTPKSPVKDDLFLITKRDRQLPNRYDQFISLIEQTLSSPRSPGLN